MLFLIGLALFLHPRCFCLAYLATRMATLGNIGEYCASSEEWPQYIERLEFFLITNKVTDNDMKWATLLPVSDGGSNI